MLFTRTTFQQMSRNVVVLVGPLLGHHQLKTLWSQLHIVACVVTNVREIDVSVSHILNAEPMFVLRCVSQDERQGWTCTRLDLGLGEVDWVGGVWFLFKWEHTTRPDCRPITEAITTIHAPLHYHPLKKLWWKNSSVNSFKCPWSRFMPDPCLAALSCHWEGIVWLQGWVFWGRTLGVRCILPGHPLMSNHVNRNKSRQVHPNVRSCHPSQVTSRGWIASLLYEESCNTYRQTIRRMWCMYSIDTCR